MIKYLTIIFFYLFVFQTDMFFSQNVIEKFPKERMYAQLNSNVFITGETLYFSLYCLNTSESKISDLSKVAYITIINKENKNVCNLRVKLKKGLGYGDYRIPIDLISGNYKVLIYTNWMKNFDIRNFFISDITIINPYKENQQITSIELTESLKINDLNFPADKTDLNNVLIHLKKRKYSKREKVSLEIERINDFDSLSNVTLSVKKIDNLETYYGKNNSEIHFKKNENYNNLTLPASNVFLPELRGEIISGVVIDKKNKKPLVNKNISISIPDKKFILRFSMTNDKGRFYFNVQNYTKNYAFFEILDDNSNYQVILDDKSINADNLNLKFKEFRLPKKFADNIIERSVNNQIRNSYSNLTLDNIILENNLEFLLDNFTKYNLDDYNRFNKTEDVFIEIIKNVRIKEINGEKNFYVDKIGDLKVNFESKILVIVDGVLQKNHSKVIDFDALLYEKIDVARTKTKFVFGNNEYQGVIVFKTFKNNFNDIDDSVKLSKKTFKKNYFEKIYSEDRKKQMSRIPDYRDDLLWNPITKLEKVKTNFSFYTSDNTGLYKVSVNGVNTNGKSISSVDYFVVK